MRIRRLPDDLTVCKVADVGAIDLSRGFCFAARTDEEISLVCRTQDAPARTLARVDGWKAFRVEGPLDFALVGVLAELSGALAARGVPIFAVSTYDTDTILVRGGDFDRAARIFAEAGHEVV